MEFVLKKLYCYFSVVYNSVEFIMTTDYPYITNLSDATSDEFRHARVDIAASVSRYKLIYLKHVILESCYCCRCSVGHVRPDFFMPCLKGDGYF